VEITATYEEMLEEYKKQLAEANHQLMVLRIGYQHLSERLEKYEKAEEDQERPRTPQRARAVPLSVAAVPEGQEGP
jgi:regulator of replication initiation timing